MILRAVCGLGIVAAMAGAFARTLDRHAGSADGAPAPTIDGGTDPGRSDFGRIAVRGLARWELDALRRAGLSAREWNEVLAVRVAGAESTPGLPPVMGQHRISDGAVEFVPRFRPPIGVRYSVRFDRGRIGPLAGRQTEAGPMVVTRDLTFGESAPPAPATVVTAIHPSSDVVPANQLRWYLEFSAPMSLGEAYRRVRLLDERGREVSGAFLVVDQELWDPARRRLTLLFDPGRVKRGIRPNLESGAPIRQGGTYTLRVDAAWRDGRGAPLRSGFARRFRVAAADRTPPDPARWRVGPPRAGSLEPLALDFGEPLDHALAERMIAVRRSGGARVPGRVTLLRADREWRFVPAEPWERGRYEIQVGPDLEDLAGNSVGRVFDADLARGEGVVGRGDGGMHRAAAIPFEPVPGPAVGR